MKYKNIFSWDEFFERYTRNFEEFKFCYHEMTINLVTDHYGFLYTIGTKEKGFTCSKVYDSPKELLNKARFEGKRLREIWDDLEA